MSIRDATARLEESVAQAMTPAAGMDQDSHIAPQWAEDVQIILDALQAYRTPTGLDREAVARIIEPHGWGVFDIHGDEIGGRAAIHAKNESLTKADAILAMAGKVPKPEETIGDIMEDIAALARDIQQ